MTACHVPCRRPWPLTAPSRTATLPRRESRTMQGDDAMKQALAGCMLVAAALLLAAPPATAEVYSVTLKNGGIIQSRQAPQAAGYADDMNPNMIAVLRLKRRVPRSSHLQCTKLCC